MILYKHFPPERIDVVATRLVRFTQPAAFNDPFDSLPSIAAHSVSTGDGQASCCVEAQTHVVQTFINMTDAQSVGILSLTEKPDNLLMWGHYSRGHTGFVLGLDTEDESFRGLLGKGAILRKVHYTKVRPARGFDLGSYAQGPVAYIGPMSDRESLNEEWLFSKSIDWEYEQEWRFVRWLEDPDATIPQADGFPIYLYRLPASAIASIVLGCRAWNSLFPKVKEILQGDAGLDHVMLVETNEDDAEFRVNLSGFPDERTPYRPWALALDRREALQRRVPNRPLNTRSLGRPRKGPDESRKVTKRNGRKGKLAANSEVRKKPG